MSEDQRSSGDDAMRDDDSAREEARYEEARSSDPDLRGSVPGLDAVDGGTQPLGDADVDDGTGSDGTGSDGTGSDGARSDGARSDGTGGDGLGTDGTIPAHPNGVAAGMTEEGSTFEPEEDTHDEDADDAGEHPVGERA